MGHIVAFEGADRVPTYHRCEELADAVSFVEKLRNDRGVEKVQIFRTEEIRFDFKPYYRVELGALTAGSAPTASLPSASAASPAPAMTPPPPITSMATPSESTNVDSDTASTDEDDRFDEHDDDLSTSGSRRGLFGR